MKRDIWIFLFVIGLILFGWPIISIFEYNLSKYFFLAWFVFIILIFYITIVTKKEDGGG